MADMEYGLDARGGAERVVICAAFDTARSDAARRLSEDFAQALAAYEELSSSRLSHPSPRLTAAQIDCAQTPPAGSDGSDPAGGRPLERLVVIAGDPAGALSDAGRALARLADGGRIAASTRIWGIVVSDRLRPDDAAAALAAFGGSFEQERATWMGGVAVGGAPLSLPEAGRPRMGRLRERASVAIDGLIGAVRCGVSLDEAASLFEFESDRGVLAAPIGISGAEYLLRARADRRRRTC